MRLAYRMRRGWGRDEKLNMMILFYYKGGELEGEGGRQSITKIKNIITKGRLVDNVK